MSYLMQMENLSRILIFEGQHPVEQYNNNKLELLYLLNLKQTEKFFYLLLQIGSGRCNIPQRNQSHVVQH